MARGQAVAAVALQEALKLEERYSGYRAAVGIIRSGSCSSRRTSVSRRTRGASAWKNVSAIWRRRQCTRKGRTNHEAARCTGSEF